MTKYCEILRLHSLGFSARNIALAVPCSRNTVSKVLKQAAEKGVSWPLPDGTTDADLERQLSPSAPSVSTKRMPDYAYIRKELMKNGVTKKLLWTEYMEECHQNGEVPLMYSQFCYYIQQDESKRRATMHIKRKPAEQVEVDWAGDCAKLTDPDTGKTTDAYIFVGVMTYSQYAYVEAFPDEKQASWINAHIHMYEYFGGVARITVPDNCKTAVIHNNGWKDQRINAVYHEMAEHYGTAIIPARVRTPRDKSVAEGSVGNISTWITAALRNEQFFTIAELNAEIWKRLKDFNRRPFQKKEGSRYTLFLQEELPLLAPLPTARYELAEWKQATVQFNYHISVAGMQYSIPYEYIGKKVNVRITGSVIEVFYNQNRIASHQRLYGRKGQYSTVTEHMPKDHQEYLEWNGDRFRKWAERIGINTYKVINGLLFSKRVEQQSYKACMGLLKLAEKYSPAQLEAACQTALTYTEMPSYKSVSSLLAVSKDAGCVTAEEPKATNSHGITRGAAYYRRNRS